MVEIKLKEKESGYEVIGEYVDRYWRHHGRHDAIVSLATSYNGRDYYALKEIFSPDAYGCGAECLNDWYEGEKYIRLFGIKNVDEIDITDGIYIE